MRDFKATLFWDKAFYLTVVLFFFPVAVGIVVACKTIMALGEEIHAYWTEIVVDGLAEIEEREGLK
jgi:hypothetical protein